MNAHMFFIIQRLWKTSKNVFPLVVDDPKSVYIAIKDQKNFDEKKNFIEIFDSNLYTINIFHRSLKNSHLMETLFMCLSLIEIHF